MKLCSGKQLAFGCTEQADEAGADHEECAGFWHGTGRRKLTEIEPVPVLAVRAYRERKILNRSRELDGTAGFGTGKHGVSSRALG